MSKIDKTKNLEEKNFIKQTEYWEQLMKENVNHDWDKSKRGLTYFDKHPECVHSCELAKKDYKIFDDCCGGVCLK
jgi:hypothetical protein